MNTEQSQPFVLRQSLLWIMAIASGLAVANLYYNQPLLADMATSFGISRDRAGYISTFTQIGYALGMLLFVPLGDIRERRKLISTLLILVTISLLAAAVSTHIVWMYIASFAIGLTTVVPQILVPFSAQLATPEQRGKVIGTVMSGLLFGILLARTISGLIGGTWGWRWMYGIAAILMFILFLVLRRKLPHVEPLMKSTYRELVVSMGGLIRQYAVLREGALIGALNFASFSVFWTSLSFYLEGEPYHYSSQIAGLFGLVGVVGALGAPVVGRIADRIQPKWIIGCMITITLISFAFFGWWGGSLIGLMIGIVLLDLGVQGAQVSNQARIYALNDSARSRLNTVLMVSTFLGGAIGSSVSSYMWKIGGWSAVSLSGGVFMLLSLLIWSIARWRKQ
ncbi:MFS transporter [Paenibacillus sp. PK4536]|uniref:Putative transporter YgaY n=1 Tax=Paenibacillus nuruki TaxID=1886670 RepID=A0A1E3L6U8_9BACL|nr:MULTISPECIES: MFS transporter [Paenibacillus]ODP29384.1 putative transporter YgaY [Paenibacillus nuruki]WIM41070.1 MFS transporter [Paenibacillus sp. PK4536]CAJ1316573.1 Putative transporter YgaY [Paenibacillus nuruki]